MKSCFAENWEKGLLSVLLVNFKQFLRWACLLAGLILVNLVVAGQSIGIPDFIPPYMAPETKGPAILNGVNYASGAAGILPSSGYLFVSQSVSQLEHIFAANCLCMPYHKLNYVRATEVAITCINCLQVIDLMIDPFVIDLANITGSAITRLCQHQDPNRCTDWWGGNHWTPLQVALLLQSRLQRLPGQLLHPWLPFQ